MGLEQALADEETEARGLRNEFYKLVQKRGDPRYTLVDDQIVATWPSGAHKEVPPGAFVRVWGRHWLPIGAARRIIAAHDKRRAFGLYMRDKLAQVAVGSKMSKAVVQHNRDLARACHLTVSR